MQYFYHLNPLIIHFLTFLLAITFSFPRFYLIDNKFKISIWLLIFFFVIINYHFLPYYNPIYEYKGVLENVSPTIDQFFKYEHIRNRYYDGHCFTALYLSQVDLDLTSKMDEYYSGKIEIIDPYNVIPFNDGGLFLQALGYNNDQILRCLNHRYVFEFLFFLPLAAIHWLSDSFYFSIFFFDIIVLLILAWIFFLLEQKLNLKTANSIVINNSEKPNFVWFYFFIFCFFGFSYQLGYHFRTLYASLLGCLALLLMSSNKKKTSLIVCLLSVFIHNGMIVFFPLMFAFMKSRLRILLAVTIIIIVSLIIDHLLNYTLLKNTKSNFYVGDRIDEFYVIVFSSISLFMIIMNFIKKRQIFDTNTSVVFLVAFTLICMYPIFESGSIERIALVLSLIVSFFGMIWMEQNIIFKPIYQRILVISLSSPALIYYYQGYFSKSFIIYD